MWDIILVFLIAFLIIAFLYGYYRLVKWLTYDFFTEKPEKTGDWIYDYLLVYTKKTWGVILLIPVAFLVLVLLAAATGSKSSGGSSSSRNDYDDDSDGYSVYQLQVRGGTAWLNIGGPRNEDGAIRSADYEKSRNPNKRYRVVEKTKNGKIISTVYSC